MRGKGSGTRFLWKFLGQCYMVLPFCLTSLSECCSYVSGMV